MGDPGNPTDPGTTPGSEPDPDQPGWASPVPPPPPPAGPPPEPTAPQPAAPGQQPGAQIPGNQPPAWGTPPAGGGQVPPGAVPPGGAGWNQPPAAPRKRRLTWLWILIPTLIIFTVATIVAIVFAVKLIAEPIDTTNDYYSSLKERDYDDAYDELCRALQTRYTQEDFTAIQESDEGTKGAVTSYEFNDFTTENGDARVTGDVERGTTDYDVRVDLVEEDDDWKICGIRER